MSEETEGKSRRESNHGNSNIKINETDKIKELYGAISEIPETEKVKNVKERQKVEEEEWKAVGDIDKVQSANQADQLGALGFIMKSGNRNLTRGEKRNNFGKRNAGNAKRNSERRNV